MARTGTHWGTVWSLRRDAATASATIVPATVMASLVLLLAPPHDGLAQDTVAVHVFTRHAALSDGDQIARDMAVRR